MVKICNKSSSCRLAVISDVLCNDRMPQQIVSIKLAGNRIYEVKMNDKTLSSWSCRRKFDLKQVYRNYKHRCWNVFLIWCNKLFDTFQSQCQCASPRRSIYHDINAYTNCRTCWNERVSKNKNIPIKLKLSIIYYVRILCIIDSCRQ